MGVIRVISLALLAVAMLLAAAFIYGPSFAVECGVASWYGPGFHGKKTASGKPFNQNALTAAHKTLPFGTVVKVTDQATGKAVKVTTTDRGPFKKGRIIDLSKAAGAAFDLPYDRGVTKVCIEIFRPPDRA